MAFTLRNEQHEDSIAEINITPFVDVVLVLLIIFMITAGVVEFGLRIDVPRTREVSVTTKDLDVVNITAKGELFLNTDPVSLYDIVPKVTTKQGPGGEIYVRADATVPWETVAQVLAECGAAGITPNMITKPLERSPSRR
jgi:biopolymer transport protein ExbD